MAAANYARPEAERPVGAPRGVVPVAVVARSYGLRLCATRNKRTQERSVEPSEAGWGALTGAL